jgi:pyruvate,orthophosphate dikinase
VGSPDCWVDQQEREVFQFRDEHLTWTTFGISRDAAGRFATGYRGAGVFAADLFGSLDVEGVGEPIQVAAARRRTARPSLKLRICRDDWRDPVSVAHGRVWGLDGVSCWPYCGPIALLGAARSGRSPVPEPLSSQIDQAGAQAGVEGRVRAGRGQECAEA